MVCTTRKREFLACFEVETHIPLTQILPGGGEAEKPILHFLWKILSQFATHNIQNYSKLTLPETLRHYAQASTVILLFKIFQKLSLKEVILSMGLSAPPWYDFFLTLFLRRRI